MDSLKCTIHDSAAAQSVAFLRNIAVAARRLTPVRGLLFVVLLQHKRRPPSGTQGAISHAKEAVPILFTSNWAKASSIKDGHLAGLGQSCCFGSEEPSSSKAPGSSAIPFLPQQSIRSGNLYLSRNTNRTLSSKNI